LDFIEKIDKNMNSRELLVDFGQPALVEALNLKFLKNDKSICQNLRIRISVFDKRGRQRLVVS